MTNERISFMKEIKIIYEDDDIILCHKAAGIATQTKRLGQPDMESLLKNYRAKKGEQPYIGIVHRLDQPVEGVMVFAKNQKAAAHLSKQVQQRMIGKYYYAVSNSMADISMEGVLEHYLWTDKQKNFTQVVDIEAFSKTSIPKEAKLAKLEYRCMKVEADKMLFAIKLHTGRQHQIRVQMAAIGYPLIGDSKYGNRSGEALGLCSYRLEFVHPSTGKKMDISIVPEGSAFLSMKKFFLQDNNA